MNTEQAGVQNAAKVVAATTGAAQDAIARQKHQVSACMARMARFHQALQSTHFHLCEAIWMARENGLSELEGYLVALQDEFEGLTAGLQPTLAFQKLPPV